MKMLSLGWFWVVAWSVVCLILAIAIVVITVLA
jgi:hypothetical protein